MNSRFFRASSIAVLAGFLPLLAPRPSIGAETPVQISVISPLSGPGAFVGQTYQKTLRVLQDVVNKDGGISGHPVSFVFLDDQTSPQVSVQLTNTVIAQKAPVVMGSAFEAMCTAMVPVLENGPVDFCLSPGVYPSKDSYVFSASVGSRDIQRAVLHYFYQRGWKRVALLTTTDTSGQTAEVAFKRFIALPENRGAELVADEHYAASDLNINAQIARIKSANPDAILIFTPGAAFGTALRSMHDLGLDVPVGTSAANEVTSEMLQYKAFLPKELYFPGVTYAAHVAHSAAVRRQQQIFERAMQAAGLSIDLQAGVPWDPALIEIDALRHVGVNATSEQVLKYIEGLRNFAGITGTYDFTTGDQRGIGIDAVVIMTWDPVKSQFVPATGSTTGATR